MLVELHIVDFAIIDDLNITFDQGLVTLTGETGAGKSIIIDAVEVLLGNRADSTMVRSGADAAMIEGTFQIPKNSSGEISELLKTEELADESGMLVFSREIRSSGRNTSRINGRIVTAAVQRQLGELLVDIHGQSEHLSLLRVGQHLKLLDRFASINPDFKSKELLEIYRAHYLAYINVRDEITRLREAEKDAARMSDLLKYQINEIEAAQLQESEEQILLVERNKLANAEDLATLSHEALELLDGDSPDIPNIVGQLGQAVDSLSKIARLDPTQAALEKNARLLLDNISEISIMLRDYLESLEYDPNRLDQVEGRLSLIDNFTKKYGQTIREILLFAENARLQLDQITNVEERLQELESEQARLRAELSKSGSVLTKIRSKTAQFIEDYTETELNDLQMRGARLKVSLEHKPDPQGIELDEGGKVAFNANGLDQVEFLIETNPGEGFKPLAKIASGGETSRLMLALKYVLTQVDYIPTLIFDEIDQGIGGRTGGIVGKKLRDLSSQHQVLCVTHLPQLAAYGSQHYHVQKEIAGNRTITTIQQLSGKSRLNELAQMLGSISESTLSSAEELLQGTGDQTS